VTFVDDDDALAGLRNLGQDGVLRMIVWLPATSFDPTRAFDNLLRVEPGRRLVEDEDVGLWMSACARPTRCL